MAKRFDFINASETYSNRIEHELKKDGYNYLYLLDVSNFSAINKVFGKFVSNKILLEIESMLEINISNNSKLFKVESDRFIILSNEKSKENIKGYCEQIISFFDVTKVSLDEIELDVTFNIGVSRIINNISDTIVNSEYALDKSKKLGSRNYEIYDKLNLEYLDEKYAISWLEKTKKIILNDQIEPYFQAIQEVSSGKITKYEVLARGVVDGEVIPPQYFLQSASRLGILTSVTKTIIKKSFKYFGNRESSFSINLTERDLLEGYLTEFLKDKLALYSIEASRVTFEIVEGVVVDQNLNSISEQIKELKEMGFKIAIDDFGIENSNFNRLLEMDVDIIKVDGAFVRELKENEKLALIVKTIINLAKSLDIETVAEFVKDEYTYETLKELGIDYAQGHFIGKAEPTT
ncbi:MAG: GGDEF domain-containing phosphodiesterase [Campylobacterota bacterium]